MEWWYVVCQSNCNLSLILLCMFWVLYSFLISPLSACINISLWSDLIVSLATFYPLVVVLLSPIFACTCLACTPEFIPDVLCLTTAVVTLYLGGAGEDQALNTQHKHHCIVSRDSWPWTMCSCWYSYCNAWLVASFQCHIHIVSGQKDSHNRELALYLGLHI